MCIYKKKRISYFAIIFKRKEEKMFLNGSEYVRVDFHLHTKADKEFKYTDEENSFVKNILIS